MDPLQAVMMRTFLKLSKEVTHRADAFDARLFMLYPDHPRVVARPMPFCEDHWFSYDRPLHMDLERFAAELTDPDVHRAMLREMPPGFCGIMAVLNGRFKIRGAIGGKGQHVLMGVAMTLDDQVMFLRHDLATGLNDVVAENDDFAPEMEPLRQLLWTIDDLHRVAAAPEPERVMLVQVTAPLRVMMLPASAQALHDPDIPAL